MDNTFKLKIIDSDNISLDKIGFDKSYVPRGIEKHSFLTLKISNLNCAQANILKQTALASGTDCAVHREVITGKIDLSDCILSGSISELKKISKKLRNQPFRLKVLSDEIDKLIENKTAALKIRNKTFLWGDNIYVMGILNVTPDSFSDGGKYFDIERAYEHYQYLVKNNADIIDIGGESTRPFAQEVSSDKEQERVLPLIKKIRENDCDTIISVDTRNSDTAKKAILAGADIINDISSFDWDDKMFDLLIDTNVPVILNHSKGTPDIMQNSPEYVYDVVDEIFDYFLNKIELLTSAGFPKSNIIIDPGLGFGKTTEHNLAIIKRLKEFKSLGCPILVGHSRKRFLQETIDSEDNPKLDIATVILSQKLCEKGVDILRVHNVEYHYILKNLFKSFI